MYCGILASTIDGLTVLEYEIVAAKGVFARRGCNEPCSLPHPKYYPLIAQTVRKRIAYIPRASRGTHLSIITYAIRPVAEACASSLPALS